MDNLTILSDLDDVLWDLVGNWVHMLNICHNTSVKSEDVTDWEIARFFPGVTSEELFRPLYLPFFWEQTQPIPDALDTIKRLQDDGHTVRVVTATHPNTVPHKVKWFLDKFPVFKWEDIVIASDKSLIRGDVLIDDGTHNLEAATQSIDNLLLFDRPHNRAYNAEDHGMTRVKTWDEIYKRISTIAACRR